MAAGVAVASQFVASQGEAALQVVRNPAVALGALDLALLWGVGNEAVAAYQGKCH
jgi:hypothetical protein